MLITYLYTLTLWPERGDQSHPYTTQACGRPTPPLPQHVTYNTMAGSRRPRLRFIGQITRSTSPSASAMMSLRLPSEFFWHVSHDHGANLYLSLALTRTHKHTYARVCPKPWLNLENIDVANVFVQLNIFNLYIVIL